jgi:hypothetical protein
MHISEKEIEIERLKTTVIALNHKCSVVDDHVADVHTSSIRFSDSEVQRGEL